MRIFTILTFILTIIMTPLTQAAGMDLPQKVESWTRPDTARFITADNIYDYMNGAGELYLGYRFDHLEVYEYKAKDRYNILVELYFMKHANDAFGLLSLDWGGEPVHLTGTSFPSTEVVANSRALYGSGLLRLWADTVYARIMAYKETDESKRAVLELGKKVMSESAAPDVPDMLDIIEPHIGDWSYIKDRVRFFRSYLVLNSFYYLSHKNILDLNTECAAVTWPYKQASSENNRAQALVVRYAGEKAALQALEHFYNTYLPEYEFKESPAFHNIEQGWVGHSRINRNVVFVFDAPDKTTAQSIVEKIAANFHKKGG